MKKTRTEFSPPQIIEPAHDTGIYRDPPIVKIEVRDTENFVEHLEDGSQDFNLDALLAKAELVTRSTLDQYEAPPRAAELKKLWADFSEAFRRDKEEAKKLALSNSKERFRRGEPRLPSEGEKLPHNVKQRVNEAMKLGAYIRSVRQALTKEDVREAALYAYLVGRYHEKLLVRPVEYLALAERKQIENRRKGGKEKATPPQTLEAWRVRDRTLRQQQPHLSKSERAKIISKDAKYGGKWETIRRKI
jgi:hypothetical protein